MKITTKTKIEVETTVEIENEIEKDWHYYFGVRAAPATSKNPGELSLDFFVEVTQKEYENFEIFKLLYKDDLFKSTKGELLEAYNITEVVQNLNACILVANQNMLSVHHIVTKFKMERDDVRIFVYSSNFDKDLRKKLFDSRIR